MSTANNFNSSKSALVSWMRTVVSWRGCELAKLFWHITNKRSFLFRKHILKCHALQMLSVYRIVYDLHVYFSKWNVCKWLRSGNPSPKWKPLSNWARGKITSKKACTPSTCTFCSIGIYTLRFLWTHMVKSHGSEKMHSARYSIYKLAPFQILFSCTNSSWERETFNFLACFLSLYNPIS